MIQKSKKIFHIKNFEKNDKKKNDPLNINIF